MLFWIIVFRLYDSFQIANTELEALRAENRSLRLMTLGGVGSSPDGSTSVDTDASFTQQQISELRDSYSVSVKSLEVMVSCHMIYGLVAQWQN